jgi:hypothetical protein
MTDVFVCKESAAFEYDGNMVVVHKDVTRVRAGHPILVDHPELFEEITVHYDVERATAAPGEKRSLSTPTLESKVEPKAAPQAEPKPGDDLDALRVQAEKAGVKVDNRWKADRLRQEIAAASKGKA